MAACSQTWPVRLATGEILWLSVGLRVLVKYYNSSRLAQVVGPARDKYAAVRVRKYDEDEVQWGAPTTVAISDVLGAAGIRGTSRK